MDPTLLVAATSAALNLAFVAFEIYKHLRKKKIPPRLDQNAQDLLHDLTHRGNALLKIEILDAANFFIRRPQ